MIDKVSSWAIFCLNQMKQLAVLLAYFATLFTGLWSMFAVSADSIDAKVTAVAVGDTAVVELITYVVPQVPATVYYRIDNHEVAHHHYPMIPDGKTVEVLMLPLEVHSEVRIDVEIKLEGIRTLFTDNDVKYTQYVVVGG